MVLESSLSHVAVEGALTWWRRVAANATAALLAKHRASRALLRVMRRWSRTSIAGAFLWWARATRDGRALEDSKRLATQLFTRALERMARKSWTAAYLLWRKRTTDARNADSSRNQGALLVTRALRGSRERRAVLRAFLKWQAFSDAVAQYLLIEDERERDHDVALRKAVSGMRTALLKASAGSALIRITRRSRFFQAWRAWKALSVQAVATRRLNRVCRRWCRMSIYGSFDWWRRIVVDAVSAEEAHKRAARLFGAALQRWSVRSRSGAFVWWKNSGHGSSENADELHGRRLRLLDQALGRFARKSVAGALLYWRRTIELEDQRNAALVAFGRVMRRWLRSSLAASWVYWRRVVVDQRTLDDQRHHAAVLFEQALCRLARTSRGAAFAWWARGPEICVARTRRRKRGPRAGPSAESHGPGVTSGMPSVVARSCAAGPADRHRPRPRGPTLRAGPLSLRAEVGARCVCVVAPHNEAARSPPSGGQAVRPGAVSARAQLRRRVVRLLARHRQAGD